MKKPAWNERLFFWIVERIFRIPEGRILPWYLLILQIFLRPLVWLRWRLEKNSIYHYCPDSDVFTIYGMHYSGTLFRAFAEDGIAINRWVRIINRADGMISLGSVSPQIQAQFDALLDIEEKGINGHGK